jgi:hypothetical protein
VAPASVDVNSSQGVQVGTGNVQHNTYSMRPLVDLAALSPHAAVTRIRQLPHDDAVDLFAKASPDDLAEKLGVLLHFDPSRAVAILADLNPRKATELINHLPDDFFWLADLPEAAAAIARRVMELGWNSDAGAGRLEHARQSASHTNGYFQQFKQGRIYWSDKGNETYVVQGPIAGAHLAAGGTRGELGFPDDEEEDLESDDPENEGTGQSFEGGYIVSSEYGTYGISTRILNLFDDGDDWLGVPVSAASTRNEATMQRFESGVVYSSVTGTFAVRNEIAGLVSDCVPISGEADIPSAASGRVQRFRYSEGHETAVYSSPETGAHRVTGRRLELYERLGGPGSELGFPTSASTMVAPGRWTQRFEHGLIYDQTGHEPVAVPEETLELAIWDRDQLGWPVSAEKPIGGNANERIQFFENGIVTVRDGKVEIWLQA